MDLILCTRFTEIVLQVDPADGEDVSISSTVRKQRDDLMYLLCRYVFSIDHRRRNGEGHRDIAVP